MEQEPFDDAQGFKLATEHESIRSVMAANVVLVVSFQFLFCFVAQLAAKNRTLALFYGVLTLYVISGVSETDTFVLCCRY